MSVTEHIVCGARRGLLATTARTVGLLLVSVGISTPHSALALEPPSLQRLLESRTDLRRETPEVRGPQAEPVRPGTILHLPTYELRVANDGWMREAFEYQGMAVLDDQYLDFAYGGDDYVIFAFEAPEVRNGGRVSLVAIAAADPGDLAVRISTDLERWESVGMVNTIGHFGAVLDPIDADRVYVMLDGRDGDGVVISRFSVSFLTSDQVGLQPIDDEADDVADETTTSQQERLGHVPADRGAGLSREARDRSISSGNRVVPNEPGSGITSPRRVQFGDN